MHDRRLTGRRLSVIVPIAEYDEYDNGEELIDKRAAAVDNNNIDENVAAAAAAVLIHDLERQVAALQVRVEELQQRQNVAGVHAARVVGQPFLLGQQDGIPQKGTTARSAKDRIEQRLKLDSQPFLNTSSYVNVSLDPEEDELCLKGLTVNLSNAAAYPSTVRMHDDVVAMIAKLWNCPPAPAPAQGTTKSFSGTGTVGSTEACLLAGIALKFRWRAWYRERYGFNHAEMSGKVPNIIISSCYQACWEKFSRFFDVELRVIKPTLTNKMRLDAAKVESLCDDKTIAVVGILGNHYNGAYDPIAEMNDVLERVNRKYGFQIGIHVDAASGGFVAPFQDDHAAPFDFRLNNVLSMNASGHKFGESACGAGWLVFRRRQDLAGHVATSVRYLGGRSDSITLNFSRPAAPVYSQLYKFLRLGVEGYRVKVQNQMAVAQYLRDRLRQVRVGEKPAFEILDASDEGPCLPVVAARLNKSLNLGYNDVELLKSGLGNWYVSGYPLNFEDVSSSSHHEGWKTALCSDCDATDTMFRIVVKSNLTMDLAHELANRLDKVVVVS